MNEGSEDFLLEATKVIAPVARAWIEYKNRPSEPLDPRVINEIDRLLSAEPTEQNLKPLANFIEVFESRLPGDLLKMLRLTERKIRNLLQEEEDRKRREFLNGMRAASRRKVEIAIPDPNIFYCDGSGRIAKGNIDMN